MKFGLFVLSLCCIFPEHAEAIYPYQNRNLPAESRIDDLLPRMTLEEKLTMLQGSGFGFGTSGVPRLGIPGMEMADGPQGVRGERATAFPSSLAMVATWNPALIRSVGAAVGREVRAEGKNVILAPYPILYRVPQSGRNFECMGEDPLLNAEIAVGFIKGTQDSHIISNTKTFLLNNQEINRMGIDMSIDERGLHELELPAFEAAIAAGTESIMSSYNKVNGIYASENDWLLNQLLKRDLGFQGFVISDWGSTHSGKVATAGLDVEMPFGYFLPDALREGVNSGSISMDLVNDKVRRVLRALYKIGDMDGLHQTRPEELNSRRNQQIALLTAREAVVLLKNEKETLPLSPQKVKSVAVLGPSATFRRYHGNGSGQVNPPYVVSVLDGIKEAMGSEVEVTYHQGVKIPDQLELIDEKAVTSTGPDGNIARGFREECFLNKDLAGDPAYVKTQPDLLFWFFPDVRLTPGQFSCRWTGKINVAQTGPMHFNFGWTGRSYRIYVDGKLARDLYYDTAAWEPDLHLAELAAGDHDIQIEYKSEIDLFTFAFSWQQPEADFSAAIEAAKKADAVVVVAGTSSSFESEGYDRASLDMPGEQNRLILEAVKANPRTVVVLQAGAALLMRDWREKVPAILHAWFPGQEGGRAVGEIIAGAVNPSGRLPITLPKWAEDSPSNAYYPNDGEKIDYGKVGVLEGYRGYEAAGLETEFPFGHGLSYSSFGYSNLRLAAKSRSARAPVVEVSVRVKNQSARFGAEVVQLYVQEVAPSVVRPPKELKAFRKVRLNAGEARDVKFQLDAKAFRFWDEEAHGWKVNPGAFRVVVGASSQDSRLSDQVRLAD